MFLDAKISTRVKHNQQCEVQLFSTTEPPKSNQPPTLAIRIQVTESDVLAPK